MRLISIYISFIHQCWKLSISSASYKFKFCSSFGKWRLHFWRKSTLLQLSCNLTICLYTLYSKSRVRAHAFRNICQANRGSLPKAIRIIRYCTEKFLKLRNLIEIVLNKVSKVEWKNPRFEDFQNSRSQWPLTWVELAKKYLIIRLSNALKSFIEISIKFIFDIKMIANSVFLLKKLLIQKALITFFFGFFVFLWNPPFDKLRKKEMWVQSKKFLNLVKQISTVKTFEYNNQSWHSNFWLFHEISIWNDIWNWISIFDSTPLIYASKNGHTEIVQLLLSQPSIEINWKNIWMQKSFTELKFHYFIRFKFELFMELNSTS